MSREEAAEMSEDRDGATVRAMIHLYCRDKHGKSGCPCVSCSALIQYVAERSARCPFQPDKPICSQCTVHCYREPMRSEIRAVMRHAGPRMLTRHPRMALRHLWRRLTHRGDRST